MLQIRVERFDETQYKNIMVELIRMAIYLRNDLMKTTWQKCMKLSANITDIQILKEAFKNIETILSKRC